MKFVLISDTHNKHRDVPKGDVLIHAGDATGRGLDYEIENFAYFMKRQTHKHKIFVPGNHDFMFERNPAEARKLMGDSCTVLVDEEYIIPYKELDEDGNVVEKQIKIWGSPWQPAFHNWAFNLHTKEELEQVWSLIPDDTDVLVTHGPPHKILDETARGPFAGCPYLFDRVMQVKPNLHVFGHIHEAYGEMRFHDVDFVNASQLDLYYSYSNKPVIWEYE